MIRSLSVCLLISFVQVSSALAAASLKPGFPKTIKILTSIVGETSTAELSPVQENAFTKIEDCNAKYTGTKVTMELGKQEYVLVGARFARIGDTDKCLMDKQNWTSLYFQNKQFVNFRIELFGGSDGDGYPVYSMLRDWNVFGGDFVFPAINVVSFY